MRLAALGLAALLSTVAATTAAQSQTAPTQGAWTPPRSALSSAIPSFEEDTALQAAVAAETRPAADRARDAARRPYEALTFWGLTPGMTVVEIEPGSADFILVARAFHNWSRDGRTEPYLKAFYAALKPGGILAVEQHRSAEGLNVADVASTGYVPESYVIHEAQDAGFVLEARSELNANPRDDHDHPFGVWTLPPVRQSQARDGSAALTPDQRATFDAVGESDRMTLRFRKPE